MKGITLRPNLSNGAQSSAVCGSADQESDLQTIPTTVEKEDKERKSPSLKDSRARDGGFRDGGFRDGARDGGSQLGQGRTRIEKSSSNQKPICLSTIRMSGLQ